MLVNKRTLNERLSLAADDMAEAYRIGVEEAQAVIVDRLRVLGKSAETRET